MNDTKNQECQTIVLLQRPEDLDVRLIIDVDNIPAIVHKMCPPLALDNMVYVKKGDNEPAFRGTLTDEAVETLKVLAPEGMDIVLSILKAARGPMASQLPDIVIPVLLTLLDGGQDYIMACRILYDGRVDKLMVESKAIRPIDPSLPGGGGNE